MKVILLKNVTNLGFSGDIKEVKDGFARNWLIPQNLARPAKKGDFLNYKKTVETRKEKEKETKRKEEMLTEKLKGLTIEIKSKASDQGRVYASVGVNEIQNALKEKGFELDKENIVINEPFKEIGDYEIPIKMMTQKNPVNINVKINPKS